MPLHIAAAALAVISSAAATDGAGLRLPEAVGRVPPALRSPRARGLFEDRSLRAGLDRRRAFAARPRACHLRGADDPARDRHPATPCHAGTRRGRDPGRAVRDDHPSGPLYRPGQRHRRNRGRRAGLCRARYRPRRPARGRSRPAAAGRRGRSRARDPGARHLRQCQHGRRRHHAQASVSRPLAAPRPRAPTSRPGTAAW